MNLPALLPKTLAYAVNATDDEALFAQLAKFPPHLVLFFEYACGDETWSENHLTFIQMVITWMEERLFNEQLPYSFAERAVSLIQEHISVLDDAVPRNCILIFNEHKVPANSFLWAVTSPYFHALFQQESKDSAEWVIVLEEKISPEIFFQIEEFILTGKIKDLWRKKEEEIFAVLKQASEWKLAKLMEICEEMLSRYITKDNVVEQLILAHQEGWSFHKQACIDFINELSLGIRFEHSPKGHLFLQFFNFYDDALTFFESVRKYVTDIICSQRLIEQAAFSDVLNQCPQLVGLDVSGSLAFSERLLTVPQGLKSLSLSRCAWTDPKNLRQIFEAVPFLETVSLTSNTHLNYAAWGVFRELKQLTDLDISKCYQINDADFKVILQACRALYSLTLHKCTGLSDQAFYELGKQFPQLIKLDISYCTVYDATLIDLAIRCKSLRKLNCSGCTTLTEKGITETIRNGSGIEELDLSFCGISLETIQKIQENYPLLKLKF